MATPVKKETTTQVRPTFKVELGKELVVTALNESGVMTEVAKTIAEKGISILAVSSWVDGVNRVIHLVTDDTLRSRDALEKKNFEVRESRVILVEVPHKPGLLKHMTEVLRDAQVDVHHLYGSAILKDEQCLLVFASADNDAAMVALSR